MPLDERDPLDTPLEELRGASPDRIRKRLLSPRARWGSVSFFQRLETLLEEARFGPLGCRVGLGGGVAATELIDRFSGDWERHEERIGQVNGDPPKLRTLRDVLERHIRFQDLAVAILGGRSRLDVVPVKITKITPCPEELATRRDHDHELFKMVWSAIVEVHRKSTINGLRGPFKNALMSGTLTEEDIEDAYQDACLDEYRYACSGQFLGWATWKSRIGQQAKRGVLEALSKRKRQQNIISSIVPKVQTDRETNLDSTLADHLLSTLEEPGKWRPSFHPLPPGELQALLERHGAPDLLGEEIDRVLSDPEADYARRCWIEGAYPITLGGTNPHQTLRRAWLRMGGWNPYSGDGAVRLKKKPSYRRQGDGAVRLKDKLREIADTPPPFDDDDGPTDKPSSGAPPMFGEPGGEGDAGRSTPGYAASEAPGFMTHDEAIDLLSEYAENPDFILSDEALQLLSNTLGRQKLAIMMASRADQPDADDNTEEETPHDVSDEVALIYSALGSSPAVTRSLKTILQRRVGGSGQAGLERPSNLFATAVGGDSPISWELCLDRPVTRAELVAFRDGDRDLIDKDVIGIRPAEIRRDAEGRDVFDRVSVTVDAARFPRDQDWRLMAVCTKGEATSLSTRRAFLIQGLPETVSLPPEADPETLLEHGLVVDAWVRALALGWTGRRLVGLAIVLNGLVVRQIEDYLEGHENRLRERSMGHLVDRLRLVVKDVLLVRQQGLLGELRRDSHI